MRNIAPTLVALLLALNLFAQAPQKMSYQTVLRNSSDMLIANTLVGMRISIRQGSPTGTAVYVETHTPTTNTNGLASLEIGNGAIVSGTIAAIDWANGPYFIETETDPNGGTAYSITGTSQLLSVPYALYAENSGTPGPQGPQGLQGLPGSNACDFIKSGDGRIVVYSATNAYGFGLNSNGGSSWYPVSISGTLLGAIASDSSIVVYTTTNAYGFGLNSLGGSSWYPVSLSASPIGFVASSGKIAVYTSTNAYGFGMSSIGGNNWYSVSLAGTPIGHSAAGNRIVVYSSSNAYGFGLSSIGGSSWYSTALNEAPIDIIGTK